MPLGAEGYGMNPGGPNRTQKYAPKKARGLSPGKGERYISAGREVLYPVEDDFYNTHPAAQKQTMTMTMTGEEALLFQQFKQMLNIHGRAQGTGM